LAEKRGMLAEARDETSAEIQALQRQLNEANADLGRMREQMAAAADEHERALAAAKRSVTRIRLRQEHAAELGGTVTEQGILVNLGSDELRFASGSAALPANELPTLDRTAALLAARPELTARIEGHTDSVGSAEINKSLSLQRAQSVRQALIERGIDASRVLAVGAGSEKPIADNATPQGRRQNRRVEIIVTAEDEQMNGENGGSGGA
jgi:outer membrane protein OmpA-like peptidoglycan-associated protein